MTYENNNKMEVKVEAKDTYHEDNIKIKSEPVFIQSLSTIEVETTDVGSTKQSISSLQSETNIKFEVKDPSDVDVANLNLVNISNINITKDKAFDLYVAYSPVKNEDLLDKTSDLINIKQEDNNIFKNELLNEECDLKCDVKVDEYFDQPCSSKQPQEVSEQTKKKKYPCKVCKKNLESAVKRKKHLYKHKNKIVLCFYCGKFFIQKREYSKHQFIYFVKRKTKRKKMLKTLNLIPKNPSNTVNNNKENKLDDRIYKELIHCKICFKYFLLKSDLKEHMLIHKTKEFRCEICHKTFTTAGNLGIHSSTHDSQKPYKCEICSRAFSRNGNLKTHIRIHTAEKPYKCEICSKSYAQKKNLIEHHRQHTGEKPFKCDFCSRDFSLERTLKRHTRIHTGEKPFKCEICSKDFNQRTSMVKHVQRIHNGPELNMLYQALAVELDEK